jgi:WD40 repeat protein
MPSSGGRYLVGSGSGEITVWQIDAGRTSLSRTWTLPRQALKSTAGPTSADGRPDGRVLAIGFSDGTVGIYSEAGGTPSLLKAHGDAVRAVRFSPDGTRLASGADDGSVRLWDPAGGLAPSRSMALVGHTRQIRSIEFSADGGSLLTVSDDGTAKVWAVTLERLLEKSERLIQEQ